MGADIHVVLEKKVDGKWIGIEECRSRIVYLINHNDDPTWLYSRARERNYELFAALAGVRGEGPEAKGFPDDASELAKALYGDLEGDWHSHSWCMLDEYIQLLIANQFEPAKVLLGEHPALKDPYGYFFEMYPPEEDEVYRVLFCFDN